MEVKLNEFDKISFYAARSLWIWLDTDLLKLKHFKVSTLHN